MVLDDAVSHNTYATVLHLRLSSENSYISDTPPIEAAFYRITVVWKSFVISPYAAYVKMVSYLAFSTPVASKIRFFGYSVSFHCQAF